MRDEAGRRRVVIEGVEPEIDGGRFPVKRVVGERVEVEVDAFTDGHDAITCRLLWRPESQPKWSEVPMAALPNDRWRAEFTVTEQGRWLYAVDRLGGPLQDLAARPQEAGGGGAGRGARPAGGRRAGPRGERAGPPAARQGRRAGAGRARRRPGEPERDRPERLAAGARGRARPADGPPRRPPVRHHLPGPRARRGGGPRQAPASRPGTRCSRAPAARRGSTAPSATARGGSRTSPRWASTSSTCRPSTRSAAPSARGRTTPSTAGAGRRREPVGDRRRRRAGTRRSTPSSARSPTSGASSRRRAEHGLEIALDIAYQASPDHPYVREHPEWFRTRPDGTIQYAENPPKKYQDIYPFDFETRGLARALGGAEERRRLLGRRGRAHLPGGQPAHQAVRRSGSG